jgi:glycerophosphoryl diester phosphodiesterase
LSQPRIPTCDNLPIDTIRETLTELNTRRKIINIVLALIKASDTLKAERKMKMETIKTELKNINDELLKLYNTPGMALQFQPSNLKILKKQIEKLITLEEALEYETNNRS